MKAFLVTRVVARRGALVPRWLTWPGRYGVAVVLALVVVTVAPWSRTTAAVQASVGTPKAAVATTSQDPVLVVGGDIACDVGSTVTATTCQQGATSDVVTGLGADAVLPLGDEQYQTASATAFQQMYDPSWGRVKATSHPVAGNHEYLTSGAAGYYGYFGGAAGDTTKGYYSWNIGAWHLIALNSECSQGPQIGCAAGSPQETWLKADLAANPGRCTLAYWHQPLFSSGGAGSNSLYQDFWQDLYNAHADVVLNGHAHDYERFAPQTPTGATDPAAGLRQFIVGTGGKDLTGFTAPLPNEEARQDSSFGAMKLVLHQSSYDWQFLPTAGDTWTDTGSGTCHTTTTPAAPVASFTATPVSGTVPVTTTFTDTSTGTPTSWSWDFGDGTPKVSTQNPQHTYTNPGTYTVTLTATNTTGSNTLTKPNLITTRASTTTTTAPPVTTTTAPPVTTSTAPPVTTSTAPTASIFDRIAGSDRYDTSAQTAAKFGSASTLILASGEVGHSVDALSAAYLAGVDHAPILLTRNGFTPPQVLAQIQASGARNIVIIGGSGVVSDQQADALRTAGYTVTRIAGLDRYATSAQVIAAAGKPAGTTALLASGTVFADALGAGPLSYAKGLPLAITDPTVLPAATLTALQNAGITHVLILGGAAAISQNVRNQLTAAGITVAAPFAGQDRSQTSTLLAQYEIAHDGFTTTAVNVASGSTTADGADALGGAALSGKQLRPLLITNNTTDPGSITTYLSTITANLTTGTLFGGVSAIS